MFIIGTETDGEFIFTTLNDSITKYEGSAKNGIPWGNGTLTYKSGDIYTGQFENGTQNGLGVLNYGEDDIHKRLKFEGGFKDDKRSGRGKLIFKDGSVYEGFYENDFWQGLGKLNYSSGDYFEGNFIEGKYSGIGTYISKNGEKYIGNWKDDEKNGFGVITFAKSTTHTALSYEGDFESDKFHGNGTMI